VTDEVHGSMVGTSWFMVLKKWFLFFMVVVKHCTSLFLVLIHAGERSAGDVVLGYPNPDS
jgi:hypothetical protein